MTGDRVLHRQSDHAGGLVVRAATETDLPAIVRLLADDPLGKARERLESPLPAVYHDAFAAMGRQGGNVYLVADRSAEILGCLQLTLIPGISHSGMTRAQIEGVRVAADARGLGIGQVLMEEAIERARDSGCGMVQLTTDARREDARRFYERLGFNASHLGMKLILDR